MQLVFTIMAFSCLGNCDFNQDFSCVKCVIEASSKNEYSLHMNANNVWSAPFENEKEYFTKTICKIKRNIGKKG